jgi:hypothetical protein
MQHLEVSCAVRPIYGSLGAKGLKTDVALVDRTVMYGLGLLPAVTLPVHGHAWVLQCWREVTVH